MDKNMYSGRWRGKHSFSFPSFLYRSCKSMWRCKFPIDKKISSCVYFTNKLYNFIFCPDDPSNILTDIANMPRCPITKQKISNWCYLEKIKQKFPVSLQRTVAAEMELELLDHTERDVRCSCWLLCLYKWVFKSGPGKCVPWQSRLRWIPLLCLTGTPAGREKETAWLYRLTDSWEVIVSLWKLHWISIFIWVGDAYKIKKLPLWLTWN